MPTHCNHESNQGPPVASIPETRAIGPHRGSPWVSGRHHWSDGLDRTAEALKGAQRRCGSRLPAVPVPTHSTTGTGTALRCAALQPETEPPASRAQHHGDYFCLKLCHHPPTSSHLHARFNLDRVTGACRWRTAWTPHSSTGPPTSSLSSLASLSCLHPRLTLHCRPLAFGLSRPISGQQTPTKPFCFSPDSGSSPFSSAQCKPHLLYPLLLISSPTIHSGCFLTNNDHPRPRPSNRLREPTLAPLPFAHRRFTSQHEQRAKSYSPA